MKFANALSDDFLSYIFILPFCQFINNFLRQQSLCHEFWRRQKYFMDTAVKILSVINPRPPKGGGYPLRVISCLLNRWILPSNDYYYSGIIFFR